MAAWPARQRLLWLPDRKEPASHMEMQPFEGQLDRRERGWGCGLPAPGEPGSSCNVPASSQRSCRGAAIGDPQLPLLSSSADDAPSSDDWPMSEGAPSQNAASPSDRVASFSNGPEKIARVVFSVRSAMGAYACIRSQPKTDSRSHDSTGEASSGGCQSHDQVAWMCHPSNALPCAALGVNHVRCINACIVTGSSIKLAEEGEHQCDLPLWGWCSSFTLAAPGRHSLVKLKVHSSQIMPLQLQRCLISMGMLEWALGLIVQASPRQSCHC